MCLEPQIVDPFGVMIALDCISIFNSREWLPCWLKIYIDRIPDIHFLICFASCSRSHGWSSICNLVFWVLVQVRMEVDEASEGFGWTRKNEIINGRTAMAGFFMLIIQELVTGKGFLKGLGFLDFLYRVTGYHPWKKWIDRLLLFSTPRVVHSFIIAVLEKSNRQSICSVCTFMYLEIFFDPTLNVRCVFWPHFGIIAVNVLVSCSWFQMRFSTATFLRLRECVHCLHTSDYFVLYTGGPCKITKLFICSVPNSQIGWMLMPPFPLALPGSYTCRCQSRD